MMCVMDKNTSKTKNYLCKLQLLNYKYEKKNNNNVAFNFNINQNLN